MNSTNINRKKLVFPRFIMLFLIYAAFIALGMPDGIFGVAWPSMRKGFGIPIDAMGIALITATSGYLLSSFFSGRIIVKISISGLLTLSCALTGAALIVDSWAPSWVWYVAASLVLGIGAGGIDAGLNTYVATNLSDRQMHWMHACYGIGVTTGPFIMTAALQIFNNWRPGYFAVGILQLILAAAFAVSILGWKKFDVSNKSGSEKKLTDYDTPILTTVTHIPSLLGMLLFFLYSGAEIGLGFWAYSILTEARGVNPAVAGILSGGFYGIFTIGRILSGIYSKHIDAKSIIFISLIIAIAGSTMLWLNINPVISFSGMIITGFAIAPVFPALVSNTKTRVANIHATNTIGMQMSAASIGAACIPALLGLLARNFSVDAITFAIFLLFIIILLVFLFAVNMAKTIKTN
ncbi:MAG: MFS transporter [Candidatus Goldbacteria bacterium]|nr:MFS transporter [Candidatus Goldiibacteriota bacterium]